MVGETHEGHPHKRGILPHLEEGDKPYWSGVLESVLRMVNSFRKEGENEENKAADQEADQGEADASNTKLLICLPPCNRGSGTRWWHRRHACITRLC
jgi:hypothetical protein